jgi:hypothetical protein
MSKHETQLVERFWKETGGTLIEEFLAVKGTPYQARRLIDGVIIKGGPRRKVKAADANVAGRKIVAVQAKASRLGMYLLGQALFSRDLMAEFEPKSIETVAVCTKGDARLEQLALRHGIRVVKYDEKS